MATNDDEGLLADSQFFPRVVVKFKDGLHLPGIRRIQEQFPDVTVGKLFSSLAPPEVNKLLKKAQQSDKSYKPIDFASYFLLVCSSNKCLPELLEGIKGEETVDHASIDAVPAALP